MLQWGHCIVNAYCQFPQQACTNFMQTYLYSLISTHIFILTTNLHCRMQDISELFNPWVHGGGYKLRSLGLKRLGLRHPGLKCPETSQQYYFYLAFENSICPDYISEKFWRNLNQPVIPVVMGGGNYFRWRICRFFWALLTLITWPCKFWVSILEMGVKFRRQEKTFLY